MRFKWTRAGVLRLDRLTLSKSVEARASDLFLAKSKVECHFILFFVFNLNALNQLGAQIGPVLEKTFWGCAVRANTITASTGLKSGGCAGLAACP
jgi:hypothetical protein